MFIVVMLCKIKIVYPSKLEHDTIAINKLNIPLNKKKINAATVFSFISNLIIFFHPHFKKYLSAKLTNKYKYFYLTYACYMSAHLERFNSMCLFSNL
jgi:hypothetical protein